MIDNISLFISVVKAGSLKSAGKTLKIPASTISRRIKSLEEEFGCKLLNRNTHSFAMTREGEKLFNRAQFHIDSVESIVGELRNDVSGDIGHVKILTPRNIFMKHFQPLITTYLQDNPGLELEVELELTNALTQFYTSKTDSAIRVNQFYSSKADFAIRVGKQNDSDLTQRLLGKLKTTIVASPNYLQHFGHIAHPDELHALDAIVTGASSLTEWTLSNTENATEQVIFKPSKRRISVNDFEAAKEFALNGLGMTLLPIAQAQHELQRGELVEVLPFWSCDDRKVYAVWYRRQLLSIRASKLIDYLKENLVI